MGVQLDKYFMLPVDSALWELENLYSRPATCARARVSLIAILFLVLKLQVERLLKCLFSRDKCQRRPNYQNNNNDT